MLVVLTETYCDEVNNQITQRDDFILKNRGKSILLHVCTVPERSRGLRFPDFVTTAHEGGKVVSSAHRPPLPPKKYSWYPFLLEAE